MMIPFRLIRVVIVVCEQKADYELVTLRGHSKKWTGRKKCVHFLDLTITYLIVFL